MTELNVNTAPALVELEVEKIFPHPDNPRKELGDLTELAESIKARGIMQNLTVVLRGASAEDEYTVIIGHRRLAAAKLAGLKTVPCVITYLTEKEQLATMLLENMQRSDLTVYEQAKGFQLMMELGESVSSIAAKTGMSETTVRRRVKMSELDSDTLKEVSGRQLSLLDFDRLAKIDDIEVRNKVLKDIGTSDFNQRYANALKKQEIAKSLPNVYAEIKKLGAKKIARGETYGTKYESIGPIVNFYKLEDGEVLISDANVKKADGKLFYNIDEDWGSLAFYRLRPKAAPIKKSKKELEREAYIQDSREKLTALTREFYELRRSFIDGIRVTAKNKDDILRGAVIATALNVVTCVSHDSAGLFNKYDIPVKADNYIKRRQTLYSLIKTDVSTYPEVIYAAFGDCARNGYFTGHMYEYPMHHDNANLNELYSWLMSLGYEMSSEEQAIANGTHELFKDKDSEAE